MFSKACEYAIKGTLFIAVKSSKNKKASLLEIAKEINSPTAFTAKILQKLSRTNIVDSTKGPNGGFKIEPEKLNQIRLIQVVAAIDGEAIYDGCALGFCECNDQHPCPVHHDYKQIRDDLKQMLINTSLLDLSTDIEKRKSFLKS